MKYVPKYCIINHEGKVLIRTDDHSLKLVMVAPEELLTMDDVYYFNSSESAEDYIWKYSFLNIDPTLRPQII